MPMMGQRIPDWQLDSLKHKMVLAMRESMPQLDDWDLYRLLSEPQAQLRVQVPWCVITEENFDEVMGSLASCKGIGRPTQGGKR